MIDINEESLLGGYRVLDLADGKGIYGTRLLGELGADVIKIEPPQGSYERNIPPFFNDESHLEHSIYWLYRNTSKRGVTLNLESSLGQELFVGLVKTSDIIFETFDPGYMESLGLEYEALSDLNTGIIVVSITDFGLSGPHSNFKGSDIVNLAASGATILCGLPGRAPCTAPGTLANDVGAIYGAIGAMLAIYNRGLTGKGQHVEISVQEATMDGICPWNVPGYSQSVATGSAPGLRLRPRVGPLLTIPCKDGYFTFHVLTEKQRNGFFQLIGNPPEVVEWAKDMPFFEMIMRMPEFIEIAHPYFRERTKDDLFVHGQELGVPICPIYTPAEYVEDRHVKARGFFTEVDHPAVGRALYPGVPYKVTELPSSVRRPAPTLGQHNVEVWCDEFGLAQEDLGTLRAAGVI